MARRRKISKAPRPYTRADYEAFLKRKRRGPSVSERYEAYLERDVGRKNPSRRRRRRNPSGMSLGSMLLLGGAAFVGYKLLHKQAAAVPVVAPAATGNYVLT